MIPTFTVDVASMLAPFGWAMVAFVGAGLAAVIAEAIAPRRSEPDVPVSRPSGEMDELRRAA